jgi:hypothetical protein
MIAEIRGNGQLDWSHSFVVGHGWIEACGTVDVDGIDAETLQAVSREGPHSGGARIDANRTRPN